MKTAKTHCFQNKYANFDFNLSSYKQKILTRFGDLKNDCIMYSVIKIELNR